ncbi:MAG TPA: GNAT family protein [Gemmatimonadales bacterium]|nr:GNAT family protein [Gemmatimonadales bacterium]
MAEGAVVDWLAEVTGRDGRPVRIRRATADDAAAVLAHMHAAGGETPFLSFGPEGPGRSEADQRALLATMAASDNALALVAERAGEAGHVVACLTFSGGDRARLRHVGEFGISVARECWGSGVGRRMIELLLEWAAAGGVVRKINLRVQPENARAIALYEALGFVLEGRLSRDIVIDGRFRDTILMGREIDPA